MQNNVESFWSDVRIDDLKRMWASGQSGAEIAAELGKTRCAVLGKIYRLDLGREITSEGNRRRPRKTPEELKAAKRKRNELGNERRRSQRVAIVRVINFEALRCVEVIPLGKSLLELGPNDCRYPFGDNAPYTFCGHPQFEGSSYCGGHFGLTARRGQS